MNTTKTLMSNETIKDKVFSNMIKCFGEITEKTSIVKRISDVTFKYMSYEELIEIMSKTSQIIELLYDLNGSIEVSEYYKKLLKHDLCYIDDPF